MSFVASKIRLGARLISKQRRLASSSTPAAAAGKSKPAVDRTPVGSPPGTQPVEETIEISRETHVKNGAMAVTLFSFCVGVAWYSMNAVGQAGDAGSDDPLAALRQEAAEAKEKHDREEKSTNEAADMMKKFQAGDFDPDKLDELEEEANKPKRPWWKIW